MQCLELEKLSAAADNGWLFDQYILALLAVYNIHHVPIIMLTISIIADSLSIIIGYNIVLLPISIIIKYFMHNIHNF